eukprot:4528720-Lingulodinium_polyedra.AAC.1
MATPATASSRTATPRRGAQSGQPRRPLSAPRRRPIRLARRKRGWTTTSSSGRACASRRSRSFG